MKRVLCFLGFHRFKLSKTEDLGFGRILQIFQCERCPKVGKNIRMDLQTNDGLYTIYIGLT